MAQKKKRLMWRVILWTVALTVGIPLLINGSYRLPFVLIRTDWDGTALLEYYAALLGVGVTAVSILLAAKQAVDQIRHEQRYQHLMTLWKETEEKIDMCMDVIHPKKLEGVVLEVLTQNDSPRGEQLISRVALYQMQVITHVDALSCSLTKVNNDELTRLISDIQTMRDKLVSIASGYLKAIQTLKDSEYMGRDREEAKQTFFKEIGGLEKRLEKIYTSEYLVYFKSKEEIFRKEYAKIVAQHPKLPLIEAIMAIFTNDSSAEESSNASVT